MFMARKVFAMLFASSFAGAEARPMCCFGKWGDESTCGNYTGQGGRCNTDQTKTCTSNTDCPSTPAPAPTPPPPPTPTPPTPPPAPTPPSPPSPSGKTIPLPKAMLAFYYFVDDCPDARLNIPKGMLTAGNAVFLSFITDDNWDESKMNKGEVAAKIKQTHPETYIAYSIGGEMGSSSQSLYNYLSSTDEDTIVSTILSWKYADGVDWDLEPPSGGVAANYGKVDMAKKIASISQKVRAGGKAVTMAGFGAWVWDGSMSTLNGELILSKAVEKFGVMVYPPNQGSAAGVVAYFKNNWEKGAQAGPSEVKGLGVPAADLAGGLSGPASPAQAVDAAKVYKAAGASSMIVWMVKPDKCSDTTGWVANNAELSQWKAALDVLKGGNNSIVV